jgi:cytochrome c-type biogenesis protein CcmF
VIADVGYISLVLALLVSIYGAVMAVVGARSDREGWIESARRAMVLSWPLITVSAIAIILLLVTEQYQIEYVASVTSNSMPTYLKITALWGGQAGSLVFWTWLLAAFASAAGLRKWDRDRELLPWVILISLVTQAFFLLLVVFVENPFARLWQTMQGQQVTAMFQPAGTQPLIPVNGQGLNPLLRHPGMIIHPPMLYLGFVGFVVPYAFAIAALVTGRTDDRWIRLTRRWTLIAWLFLSLGLILGGRWAYDVLGWGGYWGWDPVEIAAFMPWLTGTAFLHSVMVQERKGMFKHWNMILIILTYSLVIFGTFLTRSGVLSSVHAFAQSAIGPLFFVFIGVTFIASLSLLFRRWGELKGENQLNSLASRESFFLANNFLFMMILVVCFLGVIFPLVSEIFTGQTVTVGPEWYERITGPLWLGLLVLMGVAPLTVYGGISWKALGRQVWKPAIVSLVVLIILVVQGTRSVSALAGYTFAAFVAAVTLYEFWRGPEARVKAHGENAFTALVRLITRYRRRYGGYIIHLGVVLMAFGIIGIELFQSETQGTLARGEQITLGRYVMVYDGLTQFGTEDGRSVSRAEVTVYRDGQNVGKLFPRQDFYVAHGQPMSIPGVRSTLEDDFYVLLVGWEEIGQAGATFKVYHNPLVNFVWTGGLVFIFGTLIAAWPDQDPETLRKSRKKTHTSVSVPAGG